MEPPLSTDAFLEDDSETAIEATTSVQRPALLSPSLPVIDRRKSLDYTLRFAAVAMYEARF